MLKRAPPLRILLCASDAPLPPFNGVRLVVWNLCRELATRHELSVVAFRWPDQHGELPASFAYHELAADVPSLRVRLRERASSIASRKPVDVVRFGTRMRSAVARLRANQTYDIAHVTSGALAGVAASLDGLPAIIAPLDVWSVNVAAASAQASGLRRQWLDLQMRIVRRYTSYAYRPFARTVLVSDEDARDAASIDPAIATAVIPNGVDSDYYAIRPEIERDRRLMLFTGTLSYPPNVTAAAFLANDVLPRVRREVLDAQLVIAGRNPSADVLTLARQHGVSIHADVPDLRPLLATAGAFACGMTDGTGIKNKLLEAMACGTPAVSTKLGCRGLAVVDGRELLVADAPDAFAAAIVKLFKTPLLADRLGSAARRYVVERHSWTAIAARYEGLYDEVLGR